MSINDGHMKAKTEKFHIVTEIALSLGIPQDTIRKWKEPGRDIPGKLHLKLIAHSKRKLTMADFLEDA